MRLLVPEVWTFPSTPALKYDRNWHSVNKNTVVKGAWEIEETETRMGTEWMEEKPENGVGGNEIRRVGARRKIGIELPLL